MITAKEARELAGPTVEERVSEVFVAIRAAASSKARSVNLHGDFWEHGGYGKTKEWCDAKKILENQGFVVEFYYNGGGQFVDMYTIVKW